MKIKILLLVMLLVLSGCSMLKDLNPPTLTYYGEIELIKPDRSECTVFFNKYVDTNGANIDVNEEVTINKDAAKLLPKEAIEGDKIKVKIAKDDKGEQVLISIELVSPGNHNK